MDAGKVAAICVVVILVAWRGFDRPTPAPATADMSARITAEERAGSFAWDPSVGQYDRQLIEQAIASADPRAQALIAEIDGTTTIAIGQVPGAAGVTSDTGRGMYGIILDLGGVQRGLGVRGVNRVVLHELGHVIDFALVDDELNAQLDAAIPIGAPCPPGTPLGACAPKAERFAETFAKWATHDIGININAGYAVAPPPDLDAWAEPLVALAST